MLNRVWRVFIFHFKQAFSSPRIPTIFLLIFIFIFSTVQPACDFAAAVGYAASPWVFPHITSDFICQLVITAMIIVLFCDAPFEKQMSIYILPRAGNLAWTLGICLYIVLLSLIYVLAVLFSGLVALLPHLELCNSWGKIWGTLARTTAGSQFGMVLTVSDYIIGAYSPIEAMITSFLLEWACCVWLGLLIYLLNAIFLKPIGCFTAAVFVLLDITIWNEFPYTLFRFSPVTMAQLAAISRPESMYGLSKEYAIKFYAITLSLLFFACVIRPFIKKITFLDRKERSDL